MVWFLTFLAIVLVVLAAGASRRSSKRYDLPLDSPALALAILKENLLENPSERHLQKLKEFAGQQNMEIPREEYPLGRAQSIEQDIDVFVQQSEWLDSLTPLEFSAEPKTEASFVDGILRLYSDSAIFRAFEEMRDKFPGERQQKMEQGYKNLCELRDNSLADYDSLERLRMEKEKWENNARNFFLN